MKPEVLDKMRDTRDFLGLARTVLTMCEPYGPVHSFKLVHNPGAGNVAWTSITTSTVIDPPLVEWMVRSLT